jgi:hypothetical protein
MQLLSPPTPAPTPTPISDWPAQNRWNQQTSDKLDSIIQLLKKGK